MSGWIGHCSRCEESSDVAIACGTCGLVQDTWGKPHETKAPPLPDGWEWLQGFCGLYLMDAQGNKMLSIDVDGDFLTLLRQTRHPDAARYIGWVAEHWAATGKPPDE